MPLTDLFAAFRWWAALMVIGAAATPLTLTLFRRLPDRGYAFVKLVGLLIVSYLFWLLGSLGFLGNNLGGILFALLILIGLSAWATTRLMQPKVADDETIRLQDYKTQIIITELVFAVLFAVWVWVRAQNPAIAATEKPMEFAFLNGIGRSTAFPPVDPWLSGFAISYYYFGYVMVSVLAKVTAVPEPIAFNLAIAWLVAATGTAAFGLVYNLVMGINHRDAKGAENKTQDEGITLSPPHPRTLALTLGFIAAIALPIAGNLEIGLELLHANGVGSDRFWQWLDVRELEAPAVIASDDPSATPRYETSAWWWWRSSRVIREYHLNGRAEDGLEPIAEFPSFSFILGDLHPHVLALPFAFLSLAVAYLWYIHAGVQARTEQSRSGSGDLRSLGAKEKENSPLHPRDRRSPTPSPLLLFTALLLGGLAFLNTWDVLIHLFVVVGAYILGRWQAEGWKTGFMGQAFRITVGLVAALFVMYLPFFLGFRSQAGAPYLLPMLMRPTRLVHFLIIFGMPLFSITILLITLAVQQRFRYWRVGVATAVSLLLGLFLLMLLLGWIVAASAEGAGRVLALANDLGLALPPRPESGLALGWGVTAVFTLLPAILSARLAYPAMTLFLLTLLALIVMVWTHLNAAGEQAGGGEGENSPLHPRDRRLPTPSPLPFILLLAATGVLLTLGPEFVYLRDNFGQRLNTIFKFYYQAWVLFGVASLVALAYLWREVKAAGTLASAGYGLAFIVALLFPIYGVQSRAVEYRGAVTAESRLPATLNGLAAVERFNPDEYEAIMWLRENVQGTPTIVEAVGGQYSGYGRIAANTGIPTILGWAGHEYQWRGSDTPEPGLRDPAVKEIYTGTDWANTVHLLNTYNVEYIIIGGLEMTTYGPQILDKFTGLDVAFSNSSIVIYHWEPE
jgi:YYY domain-containing protein